jgi:hypothetical protein
MRQPESAGGKAPKARPDRRWMSSGVDLELLRWAHCARLGVSVGNKTFVP